MYRSRFSRTSRHRRRTRCAWSGQIGSSVMDKNSFLWKMVDGRLPLSPCDKTLGFEFVQIDGKCGTVEIKFEAKPEFLNTEGNLHAGLIASMLDDTIGPAMSVML